MEVKPPVRTRRRRTTRASGWQGGRLAMWGLGAVIAAFILGYLLTAILFFPASNRPPVTTVPDLREMETGDARSALDRVGLELEIRDTLPNPEVPAGRVLSQTPLPGQEVAPGSGVRVIVSGGAERRAIPVVTAMTRDQATRLLEASGFEVTVAEVEDLRPAGRVVGIEPGPGTELQVPAAVRLRVSSGPPLVEVPDLYGLAEVEASAALDAAGLEMGEVEYHFAGLGAEELITGQDPPPGDSIPRGSQVRVRMSTDRISGRRRQ